MTCELVQVQRFQLVHEKLELLLSRYTSSFAKDALLTQIYVGGNSFTFRTTFLQALTFIFLEKLHQDLHLFNELICKDRRIRTLHTLRGTNR